MVVGARDPRRAASRARVTGGDVRGGRAGDAHAVAHAGCNGERCVDSWQLKAPMSSVARVRGGHGSVGGRVMVAKDEASAPRSHK